MNTEQDFNHVHHCDRCYKPRLEHEGQPIVRTASWSSDSYANSDYRVCERGEDDYCAGLERDFGHLDDEMKLWCRPCIVAFVADREMESDLRGDEDETVDSIDNLGLRGLVK